MLVREVALGVLLLVASGTLLLDPGQADSRAPLLVAAVGSLALMGWTVLLESAGRRSA